MDQQNLIKNWLFSPKVIYVVLGVVVLIEIIVGVRILRQSAPPPPPKIQPIQGGKIVLVSPQKTFAAGERIPVSVRVSTGGHTTAGTDAILRFDPKVLEATSGALVRGKIYSEFPSLSVDQEKGLIKISGISSTTGGGFNGIGILSIISFKAKTAGSTTISVDFQKGQTSDSNIVDVKTSEDILEEVFNLELKIS